LAENSLGGTMDHKTPDLWNVQKKVGFKVVSSPGDGSMTDTKTFVPVSALKVSLPDE
jgi:hypothetical protein